MSETTQEEVSSEPSAVGVQYDASARNRFEYEVTENGEKFDVAHVFVPLSDERYMHWTGDLKVKATEQETTSDAQAANIKLWDDIIIEVENVEYPEGSDWKALIDAQEKVEAINDFLAVAIVEPEKSSGGKRVLGEVSADQKIVTECWFNGEAVQQTHVLKPKTFELEKRYDRIMKKRVRQQKISGLHQRKASLEYVSQDDKLGELYDEMIVETSGFVGEAHKFIESVPLWFKALVVNYIFAPKLSQKTVGK